MKKIFSIKTAVKPVLPSLLLALLVAGCGRYVTNSSARDRSGASTVRSTFVDFFRDNTNGWPIESTAEHNIYFGTPFLGADFYAIENKTEKWAYTATQTCRFNKGYSIIVSAEHHAGAGDKAYGIVFGSGEAGRIGHYFFFISGNGQYGCIKEHAGKVDVIKPWTPSEYIHTDGTNIMQIENKGDSWDFSVNQHFLFNCDAQPFFGNNIGFRVEGKQMILWENISVGN